MPPTLFRLASLLLFAPLAGAQTLTYTVCLSGDQEVPPVTTNGSGTATVVLDVGTGDVTINGSYTNLGSNQTLAHLHGAAGIGVNAGTILTLVGTGGTSGTFGGNGVLSAPQIADLQNGLHYLNIHTVDEGGGELRGQIAQLVDAVCPAELMSDPVLSDSAGTSNIGPKIGSSTEGFNLTIDCTGAAGSSVYGIEIHPAKLGTPSATKFGFLYITGPTLLSKVGMHTQSVESWFGSPVALPSDVSLVGATYHAQGFCGGYVPKARTSNALSQTIGI